MVFEQSKFNYASITASFKPLNRQTAVDNSLVPRPLTPAWDKCQISWVCGLSNPHSVIHLLIRLCSHEINDQALSLAKIHWRGWSLGTRLVDELMNIMIHPNHNEEDNGWIVIIIVVNQIEAFWVLETNERIA